MNFRNWKDLMNKRQPPKLYLHFILLLFVIGFMSFQYVSGQVYNYSPMSFDDIEINPSKLATKDIEMIQMIRQDNFAIFH